MFLVLLRAADAIGHTPLVYRSISLISGVLSIWSIGRILAKLGCLPAVQVVGALLVALSFNAITLSNELESYALAAALILGSFFCYLDLIASRPPPLSARVGFAALSSLALCAHYFAGLYLAVCAIVGVWAIAARRRSAPEPGATWQRRLSADVLTLLPPLIVGLELYERQAKRWVMPLSSLPTYYFHPPYESLSNFVVRNTREVFNLFSPVSFTHARVAVPLLTLFVAIVVWAALRERASTPGPHVRLVPALFLVVLLILGATLGALGFYPYGGQMRHQFLFFLFAVLSGSVALDHFARTATPFARRLLLAASAAAIVGNFALQLGRLAHPTPYPLRPIVEKAAARFIDVGHVNVDQFGLVGLFSVFPDWDWRFVGADEKNPWLERYDVRRSGRAFRVMAFRNWWIFDFRDPKLYGQLRAVWQRDSETLQPVFVAAGSVFDRPVRLKWSARSVDGLRSVIRSNSAAEALVVRRLDVSDYGDVYCEFSREPRVELVNRSLW